MRVFTFDAKYVSHNCDLRWHFDWKNRPTKFGAWTDPGNCPSTTAWMQPKEGLVRAAIIGRDRERRNLFTLAECDGHEFIEFRWIAAAPLPTRNFGQFFPGGAKFVGAIQGLTLVTRDEKLLAYCNGNVVREANLERSVTSHAWKF